MTQHSASATNEETRPKRVSRRVSLSFDQKSDLLTIAEVARRLRVDSTTVRRWITNGILEAVILPHQGARLSYRVRQQTLTDLVSSSTLTNTANTEK